MAIRYGSFEAKRAEEAFRGQVKPEGQADIQSGKKTKYSGGIIIGGEEVQVGRIQNNQHSHGQLQEKTGQFIGKH